MNQCETLLRVSRYLDVFTKMHISRSFLECSCLCRATLLSAWHVYNSNLFKVFGRKVRQSLKRCRPRVIRLNLFHKNETKRTMIAREADDNGEFSFPAFPFKEQEGENPSRHLLFAHLQSTTTNSCITVYNVSPPLQQVQKGNYCTCQRHFDRTFLKDKFAFCVLQDTLFCSRNRKSKFI